MKSALFWPLLISMPILCWRLEDPESQQRTLIGEPVASTLYIRVKLPTERSSSKVLTESRLPERRSPNYRRVPSAIQFGPLELLHAFWILQAPMSGIRSTGIAGLLQWS